VTGNWRTEAQHRRSFIERGEAAMAKFHHSLSARGLTDNIADQFVICSTRSGKTFFASAPGFDLVSSKEAHQTPQDAFRAAATYAAFASMQDVYVRRAEDTRATAYDLALIDWFGKPKIFEIDLDSWTGKSGQIVRVKARHKVMIARVAVVIRDAQGNMLEAGEAVRSEAGSAWWAYTTRSLVPMTPFPGVEAIAWDLPGNRASFLTN
jgi:hypothetical protein